MRSERVEWNREWINDCKKKNTRNFTQYSLAWVFLPFLQVVKFYIVSGVLLLGLSCLLCNCSCLTVCIVVVVLCVLLSYVYLLYCECFFFIIFFLLLQMTDCWLEVSIRKVLRPAISTLVFLCFPAPKSKCWDDSQDSKLPLHASHVALPT